MYILNMKLCLSFVGINKSVVNTILETRLYGILLRDFSGF